MRVSIRNHQRLIRINPERLKRDSRRLLKAFDLPGAELSILLVNDGRMKGLNKRFRSIDRTTDVLSFPTYRYRREIPGDRESLIGDIVINIHAAQRQARAYGNTFSGEVRRLLVHGFLHLMGYDHERSPSRERRMKKKERELRDALETMA